jgi:hypothetical protein
MKKIILVVLLVGIAGIAGIVRSHSKAGGSARDWRSIVSPDRHSSANVREEIRQSYELVPGAKVEVSGINGSVKVETSDTRTAEVYIERTGGSQEALARRRVVIDNTGGSLRIHGEKSGGFLARIFGESPSERVTLRLPKQISLAAKGVNGAVTIGAIDGPVEINGINGQVDVAQASDSAELTGINGNVSVALTQLGEDGINLHGINGNIELRLGSAVNASLETHGMNGKVNSDMPGVAIEKSGHGSYTAQIGSGGNSISANGINGNIRLTRMASAATPSE